MTSRQIWAESIRYLPSEDYPGWKIKGKPFTSAPQSDTRIWVSFLGDSGNSLTVFAVSDSSQNSRQTSEAHVLVLIPKILSFSKLLGRM